MLENNARKQQGNRLANKNIDKQFLCVIAFAKSNAHMPKKTRCAVTNIICPAVCTKHYFAHLRRQLLKKNAAITV